MDMMSSIASMASSMQSASIASAYSTALTKKAMDAEELAAQELLEMLPQQPAMTIPKGQFIDVYA